MRLSELDPRWVEIDGKRAGFVFVSPVQKLRSDGTKNPTPYRQSCFSRPTPSREKQRLAFESIFGDDAFLVQGCNAEHHWDIAGGIGDATFETMTITPSLDGSPGGNWHGHITNGNIVGGI